MNRRPRQQLVLAIVLLSMMAWSIVHEEQSDTAWPALLAAETGNTDPQAAELQQRANMSLERLLRQQQAVAERL
jgi:hypothetical protein